MMIAGIRPESMTRGSIDQDNSPQGWFTYFPIYGLEKPAFDGTWKPGDFEEVK